MSYTQCMNFVATAKTLLELPITEWTTEDGKDAERCYRALRTERPELAAALCACFEALAEAVCQRLSAR